MSTISSVGVVGLGNMGGEIARRLAATWEVLGFDLDQERAAAAAAGGGFSAVAELSELSVADVVVLSLPVREASHQVVDRLAAILKPGAIVVETSTVNPVDARSMAQRASEAGLLFADVALLSGVAQMRNGEGALMAAGQQETIDRIAPLLHALSLQWAQVGDVGAAMALKVIHNAVIHAVMVTLVEAGAMARAVGADVAYLGEILKDTERGLMRPLTHRYLERMLSGSYEGGMPVDAARKDSVLALELAQAAHVPLFSIQASHTVYEVAAAAGFGRLDYAAIAKLWETWLDIDLSR